jgi:hypothetical protein
MIFLELRKCFVSDIIYFFSLPVLRLSHYPSLLVFFWSFGVSEFRGRAVASSPTPSLLLSDFLEKVFSANLGGI